MTAANGKKHAMTQSRQTNEPYESIRLRNQLCFPLYACAKEVVRRYRQPLQPLRLTYTQYVVMMALWEFGGMTESELGARVHLDSGTLTPLLKRLDKQGYIHRSRSSDDERILHIALTEEGEALKDKALEVPRAMQGCLGLEARELLQLKALLDKALRGMGEDR